MNYSKWESLGLVYSLKQYSHDNELHHTHTQCPFYLKIDEEERLYFSSRDIKNISRIFYIKIKIINGSINLRDNKIYGPVVDNGKQNEFDSNGAMISWILKNKNCHMLYYTGWKVTNKYPYENSIGLCLGDFKADNFKKISDNPIISKNKVDKKFTGTSCVINFKNLFFNYYMSCSEWIIDPQTLKKEPLYCLKIATSKDGVKWEIINKIAIPLKSEWGGVSRASVINIEGKLHMWFSYRGKFKYRTEKFHSYKIGYATSENGYDWSQHKFNLKLDRNSDGDKLMQAYPHVFLANNKLFMLYNGNDFGKSGVYLAKSLSH